ncbi:hypothetical protein PFISCL1PPCAC_23846, partial [Pristionchus fissidentatus]
CLHPDGVLLLIFIRENCGSRLASDITHKLIQHYANGSLSGSGSLDDEHGATMGKKPFASLAHHYDRYDAPPKPHLLSAPQYPNASPNLTIDSIPPVDDLDRYSTMRMEERSMLPRNSHRSSMPLAPVMDTPDQAHRSRLNSHQNSVTDV